LGFYTVGAEEWNVSVKRSHPSNKPIKDTVKVSEKLDFVGFTQKNNVTIRVRNGKHKQGGASISLEMGDATLIVERIDIVLPIEKAKKLGSGEHLIDSFKSGGKPYDIYCVVAGGKVSNFVVKSK